MKSCTYCGRDNADDATACRECGTVEFRPAVADSEPLTGSNAQTRRPRRRRRLRQHPGFALLFALVGPPVSLGVAALVILASVWASWGGRNTSDSMNVLCLLVLPYAFYYLCGVIAAAVPNHILRVSAALAAHMGALIAPLSFASMRCADFMFPLELVLGTFVLFGWVWFCLLREVD